MVVALSELDDCLALSTNGSPVNQRIQQQTLAGHGRLQHSTSTWWRHWRHINL